MSVRRRLASVSGQKDQQHGGRRGGDFDLVDDMDDWSSLAVPPPPPPPPPVSSCYDVVDTRYDLSTTYARPAPPASTYDYSASTQV